MHDARAPSPDCDSFELHPIFPCRPCPKTRKRPPSLRRKSHIRELVGLIAPLRLRRAIVAVAQSLCLIAPSMLFESGVFAQTASHTPSIDRFANIIAGASTRFTIPARWIRAVIEVESAGNEHAISPRGAMGGSTPVTHFARTRTAISISSIGCATPSAGVAKTFRPSRSSTRSVCIRGCASARQWACRPSSATTKCSSR